MKEGGGEEDGEGDGEEEEEEEAEEGEEVERTRRENWSSLLFISFIDLFSLQPLAALA